MLAKHQVVVSRLNNLGGLTSSQAEVVEEKRQAAFKRQRRNTSEASRSTPPTGHAIQPDHPVGRVREPVPFVQGGGVAGGSRPISRSRDRSRPPPFVWTYNGDRDGLHGGIQRARRGDTGLCHQLHNADPRASTSVEGEVTITNLGRDRIYYTAFYDGLPHSEASMPSKFVRVKL